MNTIKLIIAIILLLGCYQSRAQQTGNDKSTKKKRMFFYPSQETPASRVQTLTLYPNPADGKFSIDLPIKKGEGFELEIYSKPGTRILAQKWNGEKIDVSKFPAGVYIVSLKRKQEVYSQKLVVNR